MEGTGEISDTDSGIILHSGSDSPTTHTKDVTTHTRAMKLKHQSLQDQLERCILELKKLCIREAELTGQLSEDYPLQPGEKPPLVRRRIGAAFRLDEQSIPQGAEESELNLVDAELALQVKIYEAARKLCREDHLNKAVKKSRIQQCKREEKKLKELQEASFQLRLEHGRSSPRPAYKITLLDQGTSDDSSLSDSAVHEEEVTSQPSQPDTSLGLPPPGETEPPQPLLVSSQSSIDSSYIPPSEAPQPLPLTPCQSPHPSLHSTPSYDAPPIQNSPWTESSLDQPYQKIKKSRSSTKSKSSPSTSEVLPPLEACLQHSPLPSQLSHLKLSHSQSSSTPTTPELRVHRQLSLRLSAESSFGPEKDRGRSRYPRRRLTDYTVTLPEPPALREKYRSHASSEDSNSEHSSTSYTSSPCREMPCDLSKQCPSAFQHQRCGQVGSLGPPAFPNTSFYQNSRHQSSPSIHKGYYSEEVGYPFDVEMPRSYYGQQAPCPANRYDYWFPEGAVHPQRAQRAVPHDVRLSPSPWDHPHYRSPGLPRQVVNEELMSWHWRSKCKGPRPRSLDRQGAVRLKNTAAREFTLSQNQRYHEQISQRRALQRAADDSPVQWCVEENSETVSQV
ncbi:LOW QUALITY PROTEIN: innate immunity activator protein [Myripristis murdjan]|uniref:LOW QUALITY PROTEIN: innate immunity activator protein n=1 Tax=Myripristis murdjan TaxID=586833 RepID=UPI003F498A17